MGIIDDALVHTAFQQHKEEQKLNDSIKKTVKQVEKRNKKIDDRIEAGRQKRLSMMPEKNLVNLIPENIQKDAEENFMASSWSVSAVSSFARHEFDYARGRVYGIWRPSKGVSNAVGSAYDQALQFFFREVQMGRPAPSFGHLLEIGNAQLNMIKDEEWKKTAKTTNEMKTVAKKKLEFVIKRFLQESHKYLEEIQEILFIDTKFKVINKISGTTIPLPFSFIPDLVYINHDGELCILDHKCVGMKTKEKDCVFKYGCQAVGYISGFDVIIESGYLDEIIKKYPKVKEGVKHFYFYEMKNSANRDGSDQLQVIKMPDVVKTRPLMEAMLYEGARKLYAALADPDYVFTINQYDNFVDAGELLDDWIAVQTMEIDNFEIPDTKKKLMQKRQKKIRDASLQNIPASAIVKFKEHSLNFITLGDMKNATPEQRIELQLQTLGVIVSVAKKIDGLAVDTFLLEVNAGQSIKAVQSKSLDIAAALGAENANIPKNLYRDGGRSYVQVQVAHDRDRGMVQLPACTGLSIPIGVDNFGNPLFWDAGNHSCPHVLISGATGSGKSVCLRTILKSVQGKGEIIILDPKYEFPGSINDQLAIEETVAQLVVEMERRVQAQERIETFVIFDELADSLMNQRNKKELEGENSLAKNLQLILQKGRSTGIHIIAATQRASTKIVSGDLLVNLPIRICFRVPKLTDSLVVLGEEGGEKLNGLGDGLMLSPEMEAPTRFQGYFTS